MAEKFQDWTPPAILKAWKSSPPIFRLRVCSVFILVALWNLSITTSFLSDLLEADNPFCATLREIRDVNLHIQLRLYQALTWFSRDTLVSEDVTLVYIDNNAHWGLLHGEAPTNRAILAALVDKLVDAKASVIALDIDFLAPVHRNAGTDDETRGDENEQLRVAVQNATAAGIPVILGGAYVPRKHTNFRIPEIFWEQDLQPPGWDCKEKRCSGFGFVNAPFDRRLIPTTVKIENAGPMESFALAVAKAKVGPLTPLPKSSQLEEDHTFGSFLREEHFRSVRAIDILVPDAQAHALNLCSGKIVMVGGHWQDLAGYGALVDDHLSAVGMMSGLGLHANYVESLLYPAEHWQEVPLWFGIVVDLFFGFFIYVIFTIMEGPKRMWSLALVAVLPLAAAYVSLANFHRFLDFLFPIELYILHITYELIEERLTHKTSDAVHEAPVNADQVV